MICKPDQTIKNSTKNKKMKYNHEIKDEKQS
jgi:hypothetical protein